MKPLPALAFLCLLASTTFQAQELAPVPSTAAQDSLLDVGIALHDRGEYSEAIAVYAGILKANPANVPALAEMSMTYFVKGDYANTVTYALEGLKYRSKYRPVLFLYLGNGYDNLGRNAEAISAYKDGLEVAPGDYMLHYNLGLAYYRASNLAGAREHLQSAMKAKPTHASSHVALGHVYQAMNKRIPAIFAFSRFLVLEPNSGRSPAIAALLRSLLSESLSVRVTGPNQRTITITPDSDEVDGNMTPLAVSLAMTQTARMLEDSAYTSQLGRISADMTTFFQITSELLDGDHGPGFCWEYYAPYFAGMQKRGFSDTFVHVIFQGLQKDSETSPARTESEKEREFKEWSAGYKWPDSSDD